MISINAGDRESFVGWAHGVTRLPDSTWYDLIDVVDDLTRARDAKSLIDILYGRICELLPSDRGAALLEMRDGTPYCIRGPQYFASYAEAFNNHFRFIAPAWPVEPGAVIGPVTWARLGDIEYNVGFNRPLRIASSIGFALFDPVDEGLYVIALHRSEEHAPFGEHDRFLLASIASIVTPLYSLWRKADQAMKLDLPRGSSRADRARLSKREWEITALLCKRLTLRQIAGRLNLSTRTIESHVGHIY